VLIGQLVYVQRQVQVFVKVPGSLVGLGRSRFCRLKPGRDTRAVLVDVTDLRLGLPKETETRTSINGLVNSGSSMGGYFTFSPLSSAGWSQWRQISRRSRSASGTAAPRLNKQM